MGLTRCYKMTVFNIYICSFSTEFILQMYIIAQTYLRFCKKTNGSIIYKKKSKNLLSFCKSNHWRRSLTSLKFSRWRLLTSRIYFPFQV